MFRAGGRATRNVKLFNEFRRVDIPDIIQRDRVADFLELFNSYYKEHPILLNAALAFTFLKRAPREPSSEDYQTAVRFYKEVIRLMPNTPINDHTWRAYYLSFVILSPVAIQLCHTIAKRRNVSFVDEISQKLAALKIYFNHLGFCKSKLMTDPATHPVFVPYMPGNLVPTTQEIKGSSPAKRLLKRTF